MSDSPYANILRNGVDFLKDGQTISFTTYRRAVLPFEGFVYWIKLHGGEKSIESMIHKTDELYQEEDSFRNESTILITTRESLFNFSQDGIDEIKVFNYQDSLYVLRKTGENADQSGIYHNMAHIVEPQMQNTFLDTEDDFRNRNMQFSSSVPLFIMFSMGLFDLFQDHYDMYPGWLTPYNKKPPYISINVSDTEALSSATAYETVDGNTYIGKLVTEKVTFTLYGYDNEQIMIFLSDLEKWSMVYNYVGFMSSPAIVDEIHSKVETGTVALKKTIEVDISYIQMAKLSEALKEKIISTVLMKFNFNNEVKNVLRCER